MILWTDSVLRVCPPFLWLEISKGIRITIRIPFPIYAIVIYPV